MRAVGSVPRYGPVDDEQGDVVGDVDVAWPHVNGQAQLEQLRVGCLPGGTHQRHTGFAHEHAEILIDAVYRRRVASVERRREHGRVPRRVFRQGDTRIMATDSVRHDASEPGGSVAHQTVSRAWDRDLVPDQQGRTQRPEPECPVEVALAAVAGRWSTLLLRDLMHGPRSYGQLREALPSLSDKVLTDRLRQLAAQGLVERQLRRGFPARSLYSLTAAGQHIRPLLIELYRTGQRLQQDRQPSTARMA